MEPEEDNKNQKEVEEEGELDEEEEILSSWTGLQPEKWGKLTFFCGSGKVLYGILWENFSSLFLGAV